MEMPPLVQISVANLDNQRGSDPALPNRVFHADEQTVAVTQGNASYFVSAQPNLNAGNQRCLYVTINGTDHWIWADGGYVNIDAGDFITAMCEDETYFIVNQDGTTPDFVVAQQWVSDACEGSQAIPDLVAAEFAQVSKCAEGLRRLIRKAAGDGYSSVALDACYKHLADFAYEVTNALERNRSIDFGILRQCADRLRGGIEAIGRSTAQNKLHGEAYSVLYSAWLAVCAYLRKVEELMLGTFW
ncbi:hypothetical protein ACIQMR_31400 [Streptomyces sp. NPDC091376]|uniref:hypothetical protein n=1 Tax=Streptomyces sp. NPDC091376 TaxID=3365994 RepID=UPI003800709C